MNVDPWLAKYAHLQALAPEDLPRLIDDRKRCYEAFTECACAKDLARLLDAIMWLTEQIVYLKARVNANE